MKSKILIYGIKTIAFNEQKIFYSGWYGYKIFQEKKIVGLLLNNIPEVE